MSRWKLTDEECLIPPENKIEPNPEPDNIKLYKFYVDKFVGKETFYTTNPTFRKDLGSIAGTRAGRVIAITPGYTKGQLYKFRALYENPTNSDVGDNVEFLTLEQGL